MRAASCASPSRRRTDRSVSPASNADGNRKRPNLSRQSGTNARAYQTCRKIIGTEPPPPPDRLPPRLYRVLIGTPPVVWVRTGSLPLTYSLSLLSGLAIAGVAYLVGERLVAHLGVLRRNNAPSPLVAGLLAAAALWACRAGGFTLEVPTSGFEVDFLIGLLTANMGLHVTPVVLRKGVFAFAAFLILGAALALMQLGLAWPLAWIDGQQLPQALLAPLSLVGAPFNLNPPAQVEPIAGLYAAPLQELEQTTRGLMMIGVVAGGFIGASLLSRAMVQRVEAEPPEASPQEREAPHTPLWQLGDRQTTLLVLILAIIALAFGVQHLLMDALPGLKPDHLPVILLAYLFGAAFRLVFEWVAGSDRFYEDSLTILLLGPTMSFVLTYAVMSIPLHTIVHVPWWLAAAGLLGIAASAAAAWLAIPLFGRLTGNRYYGGVIAIAFMAATTGWGPVAMCHLRRLIGARGPVEPMPVILPLCAFYLFPWMMIWLVRLGVSLAG